MQSKWLLCRWVYKKSTLWVECSYMWIANTQAIVNHEKVFQCGELFQCIPLANTLKKCFMSTLHPSCMVHHRMLHSFQASISGLEKKN
jgi:hypothetical protein